MTDNGNKWEQLLSPGVLRDKLIKASLFITAYEILKESIVSRVKDFYGVGYDVRGSNTKKEYQDEVLSRGKGTLYPSLHWLQEHEAIDESDLATFEQLRGTRNTLAHQLHSLATGSLEIDTEPMFKALTALLRKIEVWWIVNLEIPANPDFDDQEIDRDGIVPGSIITLQIIQEVLTGNEELLRAYQSLQHPRSDH